MRICIFVSNGVKSIAELKKDALGAIQSADTTAALRDVEVRYLGRAGELTVILRDLKNVSPGERKKVGAEANELRALLEAEIAARFNMLKEQEYEKQLAAERIDVTQPGKKFWRGGLHPLTLLQRDMEQIFSQLGFTVAEGPEVETERYNFDALNIPAEHPARDMWDTFWLKSHKLLLRTHTSPGQVRYMEKHKPPLRIIIPGKVFRYEATDATHEIQFYQLEGLMVGKEISAANFKHIIASFFERLFGKEVAVRLRPSYFPFVEPGFEVDMSCVFCSGKGCSVCKQTGWIEMAGAGMVHPHVFKAAGLNPRDWQGFAFGMGIDRIAMMRYRIPDVRLFYSGDMRFLKQF